ncbi:helix-turn-helix transcriptional regulator [Agrilactobacillus fermenti]|uniref:helix-turn-helix transcriptional regulator n=1 Tax=Agrilactobacillus fermenti TaxID=2586909 RepID=UPI001E391B29|nr:PAS domain-containing protein [Agrilactobacillus fermenti]MCD2255544.1 PAS domain-containing protein [Agrilactobacillus fermenti]
MDVKTFIRSYIPMVDFIAEILGKNSEVVLNDLTNLDHSIIAIRNNHISHRQVGDPASDLALRTVKAGRKEQRDFIANYRGVSDNQVTLRSSTYFLRFEGKIVAMICINTDDSCFDQLQSSLDRVLNAYRPSEAELRDLDTTPETIQKTATSHNYEYEHLTTSSENYAKQIVDAYLQEKGLQLAYMKRTDKIECVRRLYEQGFFQLKDSVVDTAKALSASEPSVYRYLQTVKTDHEDISAPDLTEHRKNA